MTTEQGRALRSIIPSSLDNCKTFSWKTGEHDDRAFAEGILGSQSGYSKGKVKADEDFADAVTRVFELKCDVNRACILLFWDMKMKKWFKVEEDTDADDMGESPTLVFQFLSPLSPFDQSLIVDTRGTLRRQGLRAPQIGALEALRQALRSGGLREHRRFMVILPTGVGKTKVMQLVPFAITASSVLFISPSKVLMSQAHEAFREYLQSQTAPQLRFINHHAYGARLSARTPNVVFANIQALYEGETLRDHAKTFLEQFVPDLVCVDEGHHADAASWSALEHHLRQLNDLKDRRLVTLLLTATPMRGDGQTFNLQRDPPHYYRFSRADAELEKLVKQTQLHPLRVPESMTATLSDAYLHAMLDPAVGHLRTIRANLGNAPIRMLVTTRTVLRAQQVTEFFSRTYTDLKCATVSGGAEASDVLLKFESVREDNIVDVVVQCKLLGEGYDNPWISLTVFVDPPRSLHVIAQFHGRALRVVDSAKIEGPKPPYWSQLTGTELRYQAHLFLADVPSAVELAKKYLDREDETDDYLFEMPEELADANRYLARQTTQTAVEILRRNFGHYHQAYALRGEDWGNKKIPFPAVKIVDDIILAHSATKSRVLDCGCGLAGLLEEALDSGLKADKRPDIAMIEVVAIDVKTENIKLPQNNKRLSCSLWEGDFSLYSAEGGTERVSEDAAFDFVVFCLSIMAHDQLEHALLCACRNLKATGKMIIVVNESKFAFKNFEEAKRQCKKFVDFLKSVSFGPSTYVVDKNGMFYITVDAPSVTKSLDVLADELKGIRFKVLPTPVEQDDAKRVRTLEEMVDVSME